MIRSGASATCHGSASRTGSSTFSRQRTLQVGAEYRFADLARDLPKADFINAYDDQIPLHHGLPFVFVQGYRTFIPSIEDALFHAPCPKVCIARWLVERGEGRRAFRRSSSCTFPMGSGTRSTGSSRRSKTVRRWSRRPTEATATGAGREPGGSCRGEEAGPGGRGHRLLDGSSHPRDSSVDDGRSPIRRRTSS